MGGKTIVRKGTKITIEFNKEFKVIVKFPLGTTQVQKYSFIKSLRENTISFMPDTWELVVIHKDGSTEKL